jgi:hypothetical protein
MTLNQLIKELQEFQADGHGRKPVVLGDPGDNPANVHSVTFGESLFQDHYSSPRSFRRVVAIEFGSKARY